MRIIDLKTILENFDDNKEVAISVLVNENKKYPVVTYDIGFGENEYGELMLNASVFSADADY